MIPMWAYTDLAALLAPKPTPPHPVSATTLFLLFLLNGSVHFAQCFLAFTILARSSPVAYSIASLIKRVAVICLAILWFGQSVGLVQTVGMLMTFTGLWMYNRAKADVHRGERKRHAAERRANLLLPTTQGEARMMDSALSSRAPTPDMSPSATPIPTDMRQSASPIPGAHGLCTSAMSQRSIYHPAPRSPTHLLPLPQKNTWRDSTVHPTPSPAEGITNQMQPLSAGPSKHRANHSLDVGHRQ